MLCKCVAFPFKEYIFMKDKAPLRYITERGVNVFEWLGNSANLTPIEEVWNIMKKKYANLKNNKKKAFE